jgi:two-component system, NarL family, nitrate/nitrite response regulator NarL
MSEGSPTRVVVALAHVLLAESFELALRTEGYDVRRLDLPSGAGGLAPAITAITTEGWDLALVDVDVEDGLRLVAPLARHGIDVLAMTATAVGARWGESVRYGAAGVVSRTRNLAEVLAVVQRLAEGMPVLSRQRREELLDLWERPQAEQRAALAGLASLTTREAEVLGHLQAGHQVREIATTSGVSESTVRSQVKAILTKLGVSTQLAAVSLANQVGWRPPAPPA